jgi:hypothetical protein
MLLRCSIASLLYNRVRRARCCASSFAKFEWSTWQTHAGSNRKGWECDMQADLVDSRWLVFAMPRLPTGEGIVLERRDQTETTW